MYTLLDSCLDRLDIFEFLNHVEDGLKDHYDIKVSSISNPISPDMCENKIKKYIVFRSSDKGSEILFPGPSILKLINLETNSLESDIFVLESGILVIDLHLFLKVALWYHSDHCPENVLGFRFELSWKNLENLVVTMVID